MGTPADNFFSTPEKAKALMESLGLWEIHPDKTSCLLANNIISGLKNQPPTFASEDFLRAQAWWLNGRELANALEVPKPGVYYFGLVAGQCFLFLVLVWIRRLVPWLDERNIKRMRGLLERETLKLCGGREARHNFKYRPRLGKETGTVKDKAPEKEEEKKIFRNEGDRDKENGLGGMKGTGCGVRKGSVERVHLIMFLGASAVIGSVGLWLRCGNVLVISE